MPIKLPQPRAFRAFASCNSQIVAMVPPPGGLSSKIINSAATPSQGCRTTSQTIHHRNGTTTETVTVTCNKKIKRDKHGRIIKQTDTSQPRYQSAQNGFFGSSSKGSASSKKHKK